MRKFGLNNISSNCFSHTFEVIMEFLTMVNMEWKCLVIFNPKVPKIDVLRSRKLPCHSKSFTSNTLISKCIIMWKINAFYQTPVRHFVNTGIKDLHSTNFKSRYYLKCTITEAIILFIKLCIHLKSIKIE